MNMHADPTLAGTAVASEAPFISLRSASRVYGEGNNATVVLKDVDLDIAEGEFVAIVGQSGSGKSTLMNILGCLDRPTAGSFKIGGRETAALGPDDLAALRRSHFGFVFQRYHLIGGMSAARNVAVPATYAGVPRSRRNRRASELLRRLGLEGREEHRPAQLSGGQQQRVSIARALMNDPKVILADEPTGALDSDSGEAVMALLKQLHQEGRTVVIVTHDPEVAEAAERIVRVRDGRIVADQRKALSATRVRSPAGRPAAVTDSKARAGFGEAAGMALASLSQNRMRSLLTMLGIVIGVASVIAMLAIDAGAREQVLAEITARGTDLIEVKRGARNVRGGGDDVQTLVPADIDALRRTPGVLGAIPETDQSVVIRSGNIDHQVNAIGTNAQFPFVRNWPATRGVFFTEDHERRYAGVVAIGSRTAEILFPEGRDAVGAYVLINNAPFQVIGVMEEKGIVTGGGRHNRDDQIWLPYTTAGSRLFGQDHFKDIIVKADDKMPLDATEQAILDTMLSQHGREDFHLQNTSAEIAQAEAAQETFTLLLGSIAAISLIVGGIGVMNIMLVSVTERVGEIGIRMAVGARRADVTAQFLTEAVVVCLAGGLLGAAIGIAISLGLPLVNDGFQAILAIEPILIALGCAVATGVVFGLAPARKAALLDPVVALTRN